ncbi:MAG: PhzF family phenazine biosynthesis isomerase [Acidothermus sp.]|nr:PhzF family phenazine biosynthesis isomerase [Acidothermus sp.]MCL6538115.1 PhzF family phenazine biosynthesis protein [Acidothermus sp.]
MTVERETVEVLRYAAFTTDPKGGNPAGVVADARRLDAATMQRIAAEVGYSESAFLLPHAGGESESAVVAEFDVRYFTPEVEVPFCGHATIASGVVLGERYGPGRYLLHPPAGPIAVDVGRDAYGYHATFASVVPKLAAFDDVEPLLQALRWSASELDPALPPRLAFAGLWHPVIAVSTRRRLAELDPDWERLTAVMRDAGWSTVQLVWRESPTTYWSRNLAPAVGIREDPATGSAAAAFGHYLRELGAIKLPAELTIHQGDDLGRPSLLTVLVEAGDPRVRVRGHAVPITAGR